MKRKDSASYNERLFNGHVRARLHTARFNWLVKSLSRFECEYESIIELGCYDGKVIEYLKKKPTRYLGLDANWEGGLDIAIKKWTQLRNYEFRMCCTPDDMPIDSEKFDISICMETLEHIPAQLVRPYLAQLASVTNRYIFVTIPNEIGIVFLFKHIYKRLFGDFDRYTGIEFINEVLGRTEKVARNEHKGFSYRNMARLISDYFEIIEISGHPLDFMPPYFNFGIGIIGKSRNA